MFRANTEVMSIKEFMARDVRREHAQRKVKRKATAKKVAKVAVAVSVTTLSIGFGDVSFAAAGALNGAVTAKVITAFNPLIELVQALSYPIGLTMMLGGGLFVMIGNSERGLGMIQKAGVGYVLIQMLPLLMDLLVEIAKSL
ncbi:hypothetical protein [Peribacillus simplex]|uniref:Uncharacterized protein n=1 Tax=Peribacillus simplex TaxID=1478 RepID=A0A9W4L953_9BACI|nr:hypothetical protein [Peribacillus simplex]CAH0289934.1 hypothetical protein SRABI133_04202 [Peribacillus simplex]